LELRLYQKGGAMRSKGFRFFIVLIYNLLFFNSYNRRSELEGTWIGCEVRKPLIDWTLTIKGNQFNLVPEDLNVWYKGVPRLNKNCRFKKIDLEVIDTTVPISKGTASRGINEIDGDTLTTIATEPGDNLRPLSFYESGQYSEFYFTKK
jgi:hypothetical protein